MSEHEIRGREDQSKTRITLNESRIQKTILGENSKEHRNDATKRRIVRMVDMIVPRPAYAPKYGPIEYIFCELGDRLRERANHTWTNAILRQEIINVLASLGTDGRFNQTFAHCGY